MHPRRHLRWPHKTPQPPSPYGLKFSSRWRGRRNIHLSAMKPPAEFAHASLPGVIREGGQQASSRVVMTSGGRAVGAGIPCGTAQAGRKVPNIVPHRCLEPGLGLRSVYVKRNVKSCVSANPVLLQATDFPARDEQICCRTRDPETCQLAHIRPTTKDMFLWPLEASSR